jgi:hypothetical protein
MDIIAPAELHTFDKYGDLRLILSRPVEASAQQTNGMPASDKASGTIFEGQDQIPDSEGNATEQTLVDLSPTNKISESAVYVHMLVSSKHMIVASPVFEAMLQTTAFKEGHALASTGKVEVSLPDDDPDAFSIILNIIHGLTRKVPREVGLEMLTLIAVLVDKYQLQEVVEVFSDMWVARLKGGISMHYTAETMRWSCVSWVFGKPDEFTRVTKVAQLESRETLEKESIGLPIPDRIIGIFSMHLPVSPFLTDKTTDTIKADRLRTLKAAFSAINVWIRAFQYQTTFCKRPDDMALRGSCNALLLGSLMRSSLSLGVWPSPGLETYTKICSDTIKNIRQVEVEALCDKVKPYCAQVPNHGVKDAILMSLAKHERALCGLNLEDFESAGSKTRKRRSV